MVAKPTRRRRIRHSELDGLDRGRLDHLQDDITAFGFDPQNISNEAVTFTNASDTVTLSATGFADGTRLIFTTDDTLPAELEAGQMYWVAEVGATSTYRIYANVEDALADTDNISLSDDGTGTHTAWYI